MKKEILIVGDGQKAIAVAAVLAMAGMAISHRPMGHGQFSQPISRLPSEPTFKKTAGDHERLLRAVEKRERKRLKAIRDLGR